MTTPRSEIIDLASTQYYHCTTRCVRRAFLFGEDPLTLRNYDHRKGWLVDRFHFLSKIFAINICSYAVMSNHYHLVLFVNQSLIDILSDEEVILRWKFLFPDNARFFECSALTILERQERIDTIRKRLVDISWFMRCINQPLAVSANKEDDCTGRFWEGRFYSQALLDEGAILAAMVYDDLNPIRAGQAKTPEESNFTSIQERIFTLAQVPELALSHEPERKREIINKTMQPTTLMSFNCSQKINNPSYCTIPLSLSDYLELVDETGRIIRDDKPGAIPENLAPIFERLNFSSNGWIQFVENIERQFFYSIGNSAALCEFSARLNRRVAKGIKISRACYRKIA